MKMRCVDFTSWVASGRLQALEAGDAELSASTGRWVRFGLLTHPWICRRCRAFQQNDEALGEVLRAQRERWRDWPPGEADVALPPVSPDPDGR